MFKIILVNIISIAVLFTLFELFFFHIQFHNHRPDCYVYLPYFYTNRDILKEIPEGAWYPKRFKRPDSHFKHKKKPIMLIGCSYTFGQSLDDDDTFASQLQRLTGRWVYNLGVIGQDIVISDMLLHEEEKVQQIKEKPEYIIYTYMFHQMERIPRKHYYDYYRKNGWIASQKYNPLYNLYTYKYFKNRQFEDELWNDKEHIQHQKIFLKTLEHTKQVTDRMYPNSKFIFLIYSDVNGDIGDGILDSVNGELYRMEQLFKILDSKEFRKKIEKMGIEVVTTEELIGRKMDRFDERVPDDPNRPHPSAKAWGEILPKLAKKYKL